METIEPPWRISPPQIDSQLVTAIPSENPTVIAATTIEYINRTHDQFLKIYTDGAKNSAGAGSALVLPRLKIAKTTRISTKCSLFTAELKAILFALE